ncbi:MAG: MFS transporter, partial [Acidobacteriaceae bacterium]|nr:MFS transporter [Acidobacteriaceae bacterium]
MPVSKYVNEKHELAKTVRTIRWSIALVLFASTVINYMDRQSLAVLGPFLQRDFHWNNRQFAWLLISFRVAYAAGQMLTGRLVDKFGTRRALSWSVAWYSVSALLAPLASGLRSLCAFRFLLGAGESANWPAATKAVAEWFPRQERGWAVALFDSGSSVGAAIAPVLVLSVYRMSGSWRPAIAAPGILGLVWLLVWRLVYHSPQAHPRLTPEQRESVLASEQDEKADSGHGWLALLGMRSTWGIILGRSLTDPYWYFIADWFAIYLASRKVALEAGILGFWLPFLAADAGNFLGGGVSSWLVRRGWNVILARKAVIVAAALGMLLLIPAAFAAQLSIIVMLFSFSTCCYAAWSTMALTLPSDIYRSGSVASVSGLSGSGSGLATIASTWLIGWTADRYSFRPILIVASLVPVLATVSV